MVRPRVPRRCRCRPCAGYFKPRGIPLREIEEIVLEKDEIEAMNLHHIENLEQKKAAQKMGISQPTFARIIERAYKKVAQGIIFGKAIRLEE